MQGTSQKLSILQRSYIRSAIVAFFVLSAINIYYIAGNEWLERPPKPTTDGSDYESMGWGISQGLGLSSHLSNPEWQRPYVNADPELYRGWQDKAGPIVPKTDRPPLLPFVIGMSYLALGNTPIAFAVIRIFLALCLSLAGAMSVGLTHYLALRLIKLRYDSSKEQGALLGWLAASMCMAIAILDNNIKRYMEDFITELPALALTQCFVVSLLWFITGARQSIAPVVVGFFFALMVYSRSIFILWLPFLVALIFLARFVSLRGVSTSEHPLLQHLKLAALEVTAIFAVSLLLLSPWLARNCIVLQQWMPLGTKGPITLMGGYCDESYVAGGDWRAEPENHWRSLLKQSFGDELASSTAANITLELELVHIAKREVRLWISQNRDKLPALIWGRLKIHFNPYTGKSGIAKILAIAGLLILLRKLPMVGFCLAGLILINAIVVAALYSVGGRFLVPLYGIIYTFAALGATYPVIWLIQIYGRSAKTA